MGPGVTVDQICSPTGSSPHASPSQRFAQNRAAFKGLVMWVVLMYCTCVFIHSEIVIQINTSFLGHFGRF